MARYVLVENGTDAILKEIDGDREFRTGTPPDLTGKPFRWLPLVVVDPPVDGATEVKEGPDISVTATEVTKTWTVRPKTQAELDDEKDRLAAIIMGEPGVVALVKALNNGSFIPGSNYTNAQMKAKIRAVL